MKLTLILCLILFSFAVYAEAVTSEEECEKQARLYGDGRGVDTISEACIFNFYKMARVQAKKTSLDKQWFVTGYKNALFIEKRVNDVFNRSVTAGGNTQLKEIIALALDEVNAEVAVLEESGDILFFPLMIPGNVAPFRVLKAKELKGAFEIAIDTKNNEVIALNTKQGSLLFYSRLANIHARKGKEQLSLLRKIDGLPKGIKDLVVNVKANELSLFDGNSDQTMIFSLDKKNKSEKPLRLVKGKLP